MNLTFDFRAGPIAEALERLVGRVNVLWGKEHDPVTGAHTTITADSITADSITADTIAGDTLILAGVVTDLTDVAFKSVDNVFIMPQRITRPQPALRFIDTTRPLDEKVFRIMHGYGVAEFSFLNDAETAVVMTPLKLTRSNLTPVQLTNRVEIEGNVQLATGPGSPDTSLRLKFYDPAAPVDKRRFEIALINQDMWFRFRNDAETTTGKYFTFARSTGTLSINGPLDCGNISAGLITASGSITTSSSISADTGITAKADVNSIVVNAYAYPGGSAGIMFRDSAGNLWAEINVNATNTIRFLTTDRSTELFRIDGPNNYTYVGTHFAPKSDAGHYSGNPSLRWHTMWSVNGVVVGSDGRLKDVKGPTPLGLDFVKQLHPVEYTWNTTTGKRRHGLVAQDLKAVVERLAVEFDGLYEPDSDSGLWGLNYSELIAPIIKAIQELDAKVDALRSPHGA